MSELLSLDELRKLPDDVMQIDDDCVYFLWRGEELLYIGATKNHCDRIARHIRDRNYASAISGRPIPFDRYTFLVPADIRRIWELETKYQKLYQPEFNTVSWQRRRG